MLWQLFYYRCDWFVVCKIKIHETFRVLFPDFCTNDTSGRSLSSRIPKKKAVNLDLIFRTMAKFLCVTKPTSSWTDLLCSMYGTELAALYFKIVLTILDPITSVTNSLSYITSKSSCLNFAFLKEFSNLSMCPPCPGSMNML